LSRESGEVAGYDVRFDCERGELAMDGAGQIGALEL
jgi:hypothetical protein